jgi:hypothetical protein
MNSWNSWVLTGSPSDEITSDHARSEQDRFIPLFTIHQTPDAYDIESELPRTSRTDFLVKPPLRGLCSLDSSSPFRTWVRPA